MFAYNRVGLNENLDSFCRKLCGNVKCLEQWRKKGYSGDTFLDQCAFTTHYCLFRDRKTIPVYKKL